MEPPTLADDIRRLSRWLRAAVGAARMVAGQVLPPPARAGRSVEDRARSALRTARTVPGTLRRLRHAVPRLPDPLPRVRALGAPLRDGSGRVLADAVAATRRLGRRLGRPGWRLAALPILAGATAVLVLTFVPERRCGLGGCPDVTMLDVYQPNGAPVLLDRYGEKFADLAPFERVIVALEDLPEHVPAAFVAVEDKRFFDHNGIDWRRVAGAALANLRARGIAEGSSTITMQLARNVFPRELPGTERTIRRKLLELRVAREIESRFTKHEILELYLNHIYFGGGAYGIEAAARRVFGKGATELTVAEAATLAALPKAPALLDPRHHPERTRARRDLILSLMAEQQLIGSEELEAALAATLKVRDDSARDWAGVPLGAYFIDVVREQLDARFGARLYTPGLRIHTTLDPVAQRAAERELQSRLEQLDAQVRPGPGPLQGAVVVMEAGTGDVLALVGGRDPTTSRFNRATLAQRQVGSAFKPFVFAAAIRRGYPPSQLILDAPLRMQLSRNDVWEPGNYDGRFDGPVTMREALVRSRNVPTVRLASAVGIEDVARTAREAGVAAPMDETPALALGTPSLSPLQLATAYATFATLGVPATPGFVLRVEDENGQVLWQPERPWQPRRMSSAVAYILTDMLRDAVDRGTGVGVRMAGFRGPVAGKTGTTNNATDAWFVGYTPDVVAAVWIGYDQPAPLGRAATGGAFAAPAWGRIMRSLYAERPMPGEWGMPDGVVRRRIDPYSGLVLDDGCVPRYGRPATELFLLGQEPGYTCPSRGGWFADMWGALTGRSGHGNGYDADRVLGASREQLRELEREQRLRAREAERHRRELERQRRAQERELERQRRQRERALRGRGGGTDE